MPTRVLPQKELHQTICSRLKQGCPKKICYSSHSNPLLTLCIHRVVAEIWASFVSIVLFEGSKKQSQQVKAKAKTKKKPRQNKQHPIEQPTKTQRKTCGVLMACSFTDIVGEVCGIQVSYNQDATKSGIAPDNKLLSTNNVISEDHEPTQSGMHPESLLLDTEALRINDNEANASGKVRDNLFHEASKLRIESQAPRTSGMEPGQCYPPRSFPMELLSGNLMGPSNPVRTDEACRSC